MGLKFTKAQVRDLKSEITKKYSDFATLYNKLAETHNNKVNITPKNIIQLLVSSHISPKFTYKLQTTSKSIRLIIIYGKEKNNYIINLCDANNKNQNINIKSLLSEITDKIIKPLQNEYKQYYIAEKYYNEFQQLEASLINAIKIYNDKIPTFIKKNITIKT